MFIWTTPVWRFSKARGTARLVLVRLADRADESGYCYPGVASIANDCNTSERTVQRALRSLVKASELEIHVSAGPHGCNLYRISQRFFPSQGDTAGQPATSGSSVATSEALSGDTAVTQTIREPSSKLSPIVPEGDKEDGDFLFWKSIVFRCLKLKPFPLEPRVENHLRRQLPNLDRADVPSLLTLYQSGFDNREFPFCLRKRKPSSLIRNLREMTALAAAYFKVVSKPPDPPNWRKRVLKVYPGAILRAFGDLPPDTWESVLEAEGGANPDESHG